MLAKLRHAHGYKSFEIEAIDRKTGEPVTVYGIITLANLHTEGLLPVAFRYYNKAENVRYHYTLDEFLALYRISSADLEEITTQRKSF